MQENDNLHSRTNTIHAATGIDNSINTVSRLSDSKCSIVHNTDSNFFVTVEVKKTIDTSE